MNPTTLLPAVAFPHPWRHGGATLAPRWRTALAGAVQLPSAYQQRTGGWRWGLVGAVGEAGRRPFDSTDR